MRLITRGIDNPKPEVLPTVPLARRVELLRRVAAHYHREFQERPEGVGYLTKVRGIRNVELFKSFQIGLATGSIMEILPTDRASRAELKAIGVMQEDGTEALKDQVVFPLWNAQGAVVSLCGWSIDPKDHDDCRRYLDGADEALWNYQAVKRSSSVFLVASIMDALVAIDRGLTEVIPCVTRDGLTDANESLLVQCGVKRVVIAFHDE